MKTGWRKARRQSREIYYFDSARQAEAELCAGMLQDMIGEIMQEEKRDGVLFLCIGTDRSTGDSLGPLIGYKLKEQRVRQIEIVGTLERPVHAMNLEQSMAMIRRRYPGHIIVAVDASVGSLDHVGCITLGRGSLRPGLGVCKELQAVGDIFITGIVGGYGNFDPLMLQSVRLSVVMRMADYICESIFLVEQFLERAAPV
ncbi:MAG: spore protease YyaC [Lachnospiraceae bacterium]|nr:spore protease YyaC [Lachnospiraceae bacterium]